MTFYSVLKLEFLAIYTFILNLASGMNTIYIEHIERFDLSTTFSKWYNTISIKHIKLRLILKLLFYIRM